MSFETADIALPSTANAIEIKRYHLLAVINAVEIEQSILR